MLPDKLLAKLDDLLVKFSEIDHALASHDVATDPQRLQKLAKQRSDLEERVRLYRDYKQIRQRIKESEEILTAAEDPELTQLAQDDLKDLKTQIPDMEQRLKVALVPRDPLDSKNIVVEIRAGTGGDEASLFAADLFRMYSRFAESHRFKLETLAAHPTEVGGYKEVVYSMRGDGIYGRMKYEAGVHRVQRVPATEAQGRIHTSTVTVSVLPEPEEVDVVINESTDLKIDTYASSGPGGQSVNTTNSAVRLTHIPTGLVVTCQDERSQIKNKAKALKVLRFKLIQQQQEKAQNQRDQERRSQIGSAGRSEKIRTYNFPQSRLTDHRIGLTVHRLPQVLEGDLDEIVDALVLADQEVRLRELDV